MPSGFQPVASVQYEPDGKLYTFDVPASHASLIAVGDVVRINGAATALTSVPQVDVATAGQTISGVVVAIAPQFSTENLTAGGLTASTFGTVVVCADPGQIYNVAVSGGTLAVADVGLNIDIAATAATLQGSLAVSNMTVNAATKATTNTLQFRIEKLLPDSAGVLGNRAIVRTNNSTFIAGQTGV